MIAWLREVWRDIVSGDSAPAMLNAAGLALLVLAAVMLGVVLA